MFAPKPHQPLAPTPSRLDYLDGVRGLASLYVVFQHATSNPTYHAPSLVWLKSLVSHGHDGVVVFIVLSGYCLMLPVLRSPDGRLRGGFFSYIKRRAKRIVPPYYMAMLFVFVLVALVPAMRRPEGANWDEALPVTGFGTILSHLAMIHNLSWRYTNKINMSLWSVATEWQIYFVFPVLLLARRRLGLGASLLLGLVLGYSVIPFSIAIGRSYLQMGCPWMLGSFALGMAAAEVSGSNELRFAWRERVPWRILAACSLAVLVLSRVYVSELPAIEWYWTDLITGTAAAFLLVGCTLSMRRGEEGLRAFPRNLFDTRVALFLGTFSYSLYLMHQPVISLIYLGARRLGPAGHEATMLIVAPLLSVAAGYLLFLTVERRFLPTKANPQAKAEDRVPVDLPGPRSGFTKEVET